MYTKSSRFYDIIYHFKDYPKGSERFRHLAQQHHPHARTLLEVACGTGKYLAHLAQWYAVEGLDINPEFIRFAHQRLTGASLHLGDMQAFDLAKTFDIVTCLFSSIVYVKSADKLRQTIATLARHTAPDGLLIIEPFVPPEKYWTGKIVMNTADLPDIKIAWSYVMERRGNIAVLDIHYMVAEPTGIETFSELHELGLFTDDDYRSAFSAAGFEAEYDEEGPMGRGLYIARRKTAP